LKRKLLTFWHYFNYLKRVRNLSLSSKNLVTLGK
jgi:hypothetical protein